VRPSQLISLAPLVGLLMLSLYMKTTRTASPATPTWWGNKIPERGGVDYTLFGP
jgi:hypothetical protein